MKHQVLAAMLEAHAVIFDSALGVCHLPIISSLFFLRLLHRSGKKQLTIDH